MHGQVCLSMVKVTTLTLPGHLCPSGALKAWKCGMIGVAWKGDKSSFMMCMYDMRYDGVYVYVYCTSVYIYIRHDMIIMEVMMS